MNAAKRLVLAMLILALVLEPLSGYVQARIAISFGATGDLTFSVVDTSRTKDALYKVSGWVVRKAPVCEDPRLEVWDQQCAPMSGSGPTATFKKFTAGEPVELRGRTYTTYTVPKAEVEKLLMTEGFTNVKEGETLYFSAIFQLYEKNAAGSLTPISGEYTSLASVMNARQWSVKSGFRQYYDIPVQFTSKNPLYLAYRDTAGKELAPAKLIGHYPAGAYPGPVSLGQVLQLNGTELELAGSWIERNAEPNPKTRLFEVDGSYTTRNISIGYGGSTIVAIYDAEGSRVDAKFVDESGKALRTDALVGHYRTGKQASYVYPNQLTSGGQLYELVRSYHTSRSDVVNRTFEQTSGSALTNRTVTVQTGGHYLWGVYRLTEASAVTVDLSLHVPGYIDNTMTNATGTLEALINTNTELDRYELVSLTNATLVNPSLKNGSLSGQSKSLSLAVNVPMSTSSAMISAKIRVFNKEGDMAEDTVGETVMKVSGSGSGSLDTSHKAVIAADDRGSEKFKVSQGIPSTEQLYANVTDAKEYVSEYSYQALTGTRTYYITVKKTYTKYWYVTVNDWGTCTEEGEDGETSTYACITGTHEETEYGSPVEYSMTYAVSRPFAYYTANKFALYGIDHAQLNNAALPGGSVKLEPQGYTAPTADVWHSAEETDHVQDAPVQSYSVDLGSSSVHESSWSSLDFYAGFESAAESQVGQVLVRNDRLIVEGTTVMDDSWTSASAPVPGSIPEPGLIGDDVLYASGLEIPAETANEVYASTGNLRYALVSSLFNPAGEVNVPLGPNPVTVHTPVVNDSSIPDTNRKYDQRMTQDLSKPVLVLDRPFTLEFDETAPHLAIHGYGDRDYSAYTDEKRVQFPFGVYDAARTVYYPENTWIDVPVGEHSMTFWMPTWVDEGDYQVTTQAWAVNRGSDEAACQTGLNGDRANTCAEQVIEVGVTGRLHSFRIWDIGDFRFEDVFRQAPGSLKHTGVTYVSGKRDPNGNPKPGAVIPDSLVLPVRPGSHPVQPNTVPHNGYPILFDFKSIGNYWDKGEGVRIEPTFWFVSKDGSKRQQADLYYNAAGGADKMIRVGSTEDQNLYTRSYVLPAPERNIDEGVAEYAARYEYYWLMTPAERSKQTWAEFYEAYKTRKTPIAKGYGLEVLSYKARTLTGPTGIPTGVDANKARRSVQQWYGEYHVPIAPFILPKGTDIHALTKTYGGVLTGREKEFLSGGYILVNFGIYTVRNNDENTPLLGYRTPHADMWAIEGQVKSAGGFTFQSGDIILFESDYSAQNDYAGAGG